MLSAFMQSSIALDDVLSRQDALNLFNQISWRVFANNTIVEEDENG